MHRRAAHPMPLCSVLCVVRYLRGPVVSGEGGHRDYQRQLWYAPVAGIEWGQSDASRTTTHTGSVYVIDEATMDDVCILEG